MVLESLEVLSTYWFLGGDGRGGDGPIYRPPESSFVGMTSGPNSPKEMVLPCISTLTATDGPSRPEPDHWQLLIFIARRSAAPWVCKPYAWLNQIADRHARLRARQAGSVPGRLAVRADGRSFLPIAATDSLAAKFARPTGASAGVKPTPRSY